MWRIRGLKIVFVVLATVVILVGAASVFTEAQAAPCRCPLVYAPVICNNGTYPNLCVAQCHHGQNCQPIPILPPTP